MKTLPAIFQGEEEGGGEGAGGGGWRLLLTAENNPGVYTLGYERQTRLIP